MTYHEAKQIEALWLCGGRTDPDELAEARRIIAEHKPENTK